jgi:hypothetical protein
VAASTLASVSTPDADSEAFARSNGASSRDESSPAASAGDYEQVDALPVLAPVPRVVPQYPSAPPNRLIPAAIPAVQAAAAAAGGFVAGAAVVGFVHRRHRRAAALGKARGARRVAGRSGASSAAADRAAELIQIVGSRSLLVDVHLLGSRDPGSRN